MAPTFRPSTRRVETANLALGINFEEGFSKLTMRKIVKRAKISEAAIYRHFEKKEDILKELTEMAMMGNRFWLGKEEEVPIKALEEIMKNQFKILEKNPHFTSCSLMSRYSSLPALKRVYERKPIKEGRDNRVFC